MADVLSGINIIGILVNLEIEIYFAQSFKKMDPEVIWLGNQELG